MVEELKPGQKFTTPTPGFGDRVFYETLLRQRPDSEMAQEWCVYYGVLPEDEAKRLNEVVMKRKKKMRISGEVTSPPTKKKAKKKAKVIKDEAVDPEMHASGAERVGSAVL